MANHKSAKKEHGQSLKNATRNRSITSKFKTFIKKVLDAVKKGDFQEATSAFRSAESEIMKAKKHKVLKPRNAARKVSKLAHKVKAVEKDTGIVSVEKELKSKKKPSEKS